MFQQALWMIQMLTRLRTTGQSRMSMLLRNISAKWPMSIPKWRRKQAALRGGECVVRDLGKWGLIFSLHTHFHMSLGRRDSLPALTILRCWAVGLSQICDSVTKWWDTLHLWLLEGSPPKDGGRETTQAQAGLGSVRSSGFETDSLTGAVWYCRITYTRVSQIPGELMRE